MWLTPLGSREIRWVFSGVLGVGPVVSAVEFRSVVGRHPGGVGRCSSAERGGAAHCEALACLLGAFRGCEGSGWPGFGVAGVLLPLGGVGFGGGDPGRVWSAGPLSASGGCSWCGMWCLLLVGDQGVLVGRSK